MIGREDINMKNYQGDEEKKHKHFQENNSILSKSVFKFLNLNTQDKSLIRHEMQYSFKLAACILLKGVYCKEN